MLFKPLFFFILFFHGNECGSGSSYFGSYIFLFGSTLTGDPPFLSCYSTTTTGEGNKRCYNSSYNRSQWLNTAFFPFSLFLNDQHKKGEESYGCEIDEAFPYKTRGGLCDLPSSLLSLSSVVCPYRRDEIFIKSDDDGEEGGDQCGIKENPWLSFEEGKNHLGRNGNLFSFSLPLFNLNFFVLFK
jgi:hypothetical protein